MKYTLGEIVDVIVTTITIASIAMVILIFYAMFVELFPSEPKKPTVKCTDGKLYYVSYDGNITIYEKRPFTTCDER